MICSIPLSRLGPVDKMMWSDSTKGSFSVKSAYHLEHSRVRAGKGESSMMADVEVVWESIWKSNV